MQPGVVLRKVPAEITKGNGWAWDSRGWLTVNTPGAVLENVELTAGISIEASNVTVRNVRVIQPGDGFGIAIRRAANTLIENSEIAGPDGGSNRLLVAIKDIYGDSSGTRVLRNDIWNVSTGVQIYGGLIQDNYIHDLGYKAGDHTNGTTDNGGSREQLILRHNTVFNPHDQTDAISLFQDFGLQTNRIIDSNLVAGGGYSIYGGANAGAPVPTGIQITNNRFARIYFPNGGYWGPVAAWNSGGAGNVFSGNIWDDTGRPLNV